MNVAMVILIRQTFRNTVLLLLFLLLLKILIISLYIAFVKFTAHFRIITHYWCSLLMLELRKWKD